MNQLPPLVHPLLVVLAIPAICGCSDIPRDWPTREFSSAAWQALSHEQRFVLVRDLVRSEVLSDKTRSEVVSLLGAPSFECTEGGCAYLDYVVKVADPGERTLNAVYLLTLDLREERVHRVRIRAD